MPESPTPTLSDAVRADVRQFAIYSAGLMPERTGILRWISLLLTPPMLCALLYRLSHGCHRRGLAACGRLLARLNFLVHKVEIDPAAEIGPGLYIPHPVGVVFHGCAGARLTLYSRSVVVPAGFGHGIVGAPRLGSDVTIGANAVVRGALTIGDRCFVGATATVARDVAACTYVLDRLGRRTRAGT